MQRDYVALTILISATSIFFGVWQESFGAGLFCFFLLASVNEILH